MQIILPIKKRHTPTILCPRVLTTHPPSIPWSSKIVGVNIFQVRDIVWLSSFRDVVSWRIEQLFQPCEVAPWCNRVIVQRQHRQQPKYKRQEPYFRKEVSASRRHRVSFKCAVLSTGKKGGFVIWRDSCRHANGNVSGCAWLLLHPTWWPFILRTLVGYQLWHFNVICLN